LTAEVERYLAKARESLASARADLDAARFNSAANRAYYAAFQAAVAMLLESGVRPRGDSWEHKFVIAEFSGTLVSRRKIIAGRFRGTLGALFDIRVIADYQTRDVSQRQARKALSQASELVGEVQQRLRLEESDGS